MTETQKTMSPSEREKLLQESRAMLASGNLPRAAQLCTQVLQGTVDDVEAHVLMMGIAMQHGSMDHAEAYSRRCVELEPTQFRHMANLGKIYQVTGRLQDAAGMYERALSLQPGFGFALAGKADVLNQLGHVDLALQTLENAVSQKGETPDMGLIYAQIMQQNSRHADAVEVAQRNLKKDGLELSLQVRLMLLTGRSLEHMGNWDGAFEMYTRANHARSRASRFDPAGYEKGVDSLIQFFTPERLKTLHRSTSRAKTPVFIVGMARSGTTLIEQIISAHPQAAGAGETIALEKLVSAQRMKSTPPANYPDLLAQMSEAELDDMATAYVRETSAQTPNAMRIVDKYLRNHHHVGLISLLFRHARIIHCKRDPLDTCWSCYTSPLSPMMHAYCSDFANLGAYHRQFDRLMSHWHSVIEAPILEVQYENLVADQEKVIRKIIDFCGLMWDDSCLRYYESNRPARTISFDQVRKPISNKSIGRYRRFEQHLGPLKRALGLNGT